MHGDTLKQLHLLKTVSEHAMFIFSLKLELKQVYLNLSYHQSSPYSAFLQERGRIKIAELSVPVGTMGIAFRV